MEIYHTIHLQTSSQAYDILFGKSMMANAAELPIIEQLQPTKILVLSDSNVERLYTRSVVQGFTNKKFEVHTFTIPSGEPSKSLHQYEQVISFMLENSFDRKSLLIAVGGGVVGDLGGFVAATYMRGIPFIQMPTTILAHDSSVGGKVAINHPLGKNTIGAFYQPQAVLYDMETLRSLPDNEVKSGLAEVVKHGHIRSPELISWLDKHFRNIQQLDYRTLAGMLYRSCNVKAEIVAVDEREEGIRAFLNFGHTVAHGIESALGYGKIPHGLAVAIGMVSAGILGYQKGIMPLSAMEQIIEINHKFSLPCKLPNPLEPQDIIEYIYHDKKNIGGELTFVLLKDIGDPTIVKGISTEEVISALREQQKLGSR